MYSSVTRYFSRATSAIDYRPPVPLLHSSLPTRLCTILSPSRIHRLIDWLLNRFRVDWIDFALIIHIILLHYYFQFQFWFSCSNRARVCTPIIYVLFLFLFRNAINRQASLVLLQFWSFLSELDSSFHPIFLLRCGSDSALYELSLLDSSRFFLAVTIPRHG